jgi:hypothetical protein
MVNQSARTLTVAPPDVNHQAGSSRQKPGKRAAFLTLLDPYGRPFAQIG